MNDKLWKHQEIQTMQMHNDIYLQTSDYKITYVFWLIWAQMSKCLWEQSWPCISSTYKYLAQFLFPLHIHEKEPIRKAEWQPDLLTGTVRELDLDNIMRNQSAWAQTFSDTFALWVICSGAEILLSITNLSYLYFFKMFTYMKKSSHSEKNNIYRNNSIHIINHFITTGYLNELIIV